MSHMKFSAIIVLGNLMSQSGKLNAESSARMEVAIEAFHNQLAPCMVACGWDYREDSSITIADAMKTYAIEVGGIPSEVILTEKMSRDTVGDAVFTKKNLAIKREWSSLLIVTSDYHVIRTNEIFSFIYGKSFGIKVVAASTGKKVGESVLNSELKSIQAFYQTFRGVDAGDDVSILKCLVERHPYYNGCIYSAL
ncbi:MAG: YdcF family protein [Thiomicrorhabdus sp.]|nr:YdcF family protein [Thiomicrorhabdus sp.]